jgi:hypothetical protein
VCMALMDFYFYLKLKLVASYSLLLNFPITGHLVRG